MKDFAQLQWLVSPNKLWSRQEILAKPCPVPRSRGIYGWFFKEIPPGIPTNDCITHQGLKLLYVGICPGRTRGNRPLSKRTIYDRICREHLTGNAEGSTLRLSLGVLLAEATGFPLRCIVSTKSPGKPKNKLRKTLTNQGEKVLDAWLDANAFLVWCELQEPWLLEEALLHEMSLPLNLQGNQHHPFHARLSHLRATAKKKAIAMPAIREIEPRS